jgi:hypothetical protein
VPAHPAVAPDSDATVGVAELDVCLGHQAAASRRYCLDRCGTTPTRWASSSSQSTSCGPGSGGSTSWKPRRRIRPRVSPVAAASSRSNSAWVIEVGFLKGNKAARSTARETKNKKSEKSPESRTTINYCWWRTSSANWLRARQPRPRAPSCGKRMGLALVQRPARDRRSIRLRLSVRHGWPAERQALPVALDQPLRRRRSGLRRWVR